MAYTTTANVNILLGPHAVTATTPLTTTQLTSLIGFVSQQIDGALRANGVSTVPATDATVTAYLATLESWGAAAQALKILFPEAIGPGEQPAHAFWQKLFDGAMKFLPEIIAGWEAASLISLLSSGARQASSYFTEHPDEEAELGDLAGASLFKVDDLEEHPW